jgi:hypothetical protein
MARSREEWGKEEVLAVGSWLATSDGLLCGNVEEHRQFKLRTLQETPRGYGAGAVGPFL